MERKERLLRAIEAHVNQRPGFDSRNYGDAKSWNADRRKALRDKRDAERLIRACAIGGSVTAEHILAGTRAYSGRLILSGNPDGSVTAEYCTGQYFPTEYRAAACAVLSAALWEAYREPDDTGDTLRAKFRRMFGNRIARRWFD